MPNPALSIDPKMETLVVAGPPHALRGRMRLRNESKEKLKLRYLAVRGRAGEKEARELAVSTMQAAARLRPGEQAMVAMQLALGGQTAPGVYNLEVEVGDCTVPVEAHVTEYVDLRIEPTVVTLLVGADRTIERNFVAENAGNVPLSLGERCEAPLLDSIDLVTAFREGLRRTVGEDLKPKMAKILDEMGRTQAGPLLVHRERVTLRPGERRQGKVRFEMPADIKPSRHYRAILELYNATVRVDIYTTEKASRREGSARSE